MFCSKVGMWQLILWFDLWSFITWFAWSRLEMDSVRRDKWCCQTFWVESAAQWFRFLVCFSLITGLSSEAWIRNRPREEAVVRSVCHMQDGDRKPCSCCQEEGRVASSVTSAIENALVCILSSAATRKRSSWKSHQTQIRMTWLWFQQDTLIDADDFRLNHTSFTCRPAALDVVVVVRVFVIKSRSKANSCLNIYWTQTSFISNKIPLRPMSHLSWTTVSCTFPMFLTCYTRCSGLCSSILWISETFFSASEGQSAFSKIFSNYYHRPWFLSWYEYATCIIYTRCSKL